jgi:hypothetical protein
MRSVDQAEAAKNETVKTADATQRATVFLKNMNNYAMAQTVRGFPPANLRLSSPTIVPGASIALKLPFGGVIIES